MAKEVKDDQTEKRKALQLTIEKLEKTYGKGVVMSLNDRQLEGIETISTGSLGLDIALGARGLPKGRVIEIYGPESSGKTTLALHMAAEVQKTGGTAAFVDAEHALDPEYAARIGIKLNNLLISQPDTGEQALDIVETLVRSNAVDIIVVDSVAALTPRAEIEGEMGDSHMGLQARLMSQALRKLTGIISKSKTTVIFINQIRMKIGVMFGNPETTTGGNALKFYASVRLEVRKAAQIKQGEKIIGSRVKVKVVKNKVAAPFRVAEFDIMYNEGISRAGDLLDTGVAYRVITKNGNTFSFGETKLGVGRENAKNTLKQDVEVLAKIDAEIREKFKAGELPQSEVVAEE